MLVDFFDSESIAGGVLDALLNAQHHREKKKKARVTAQTYDIERGNKRYLELMGIG